jgi:hypothetical protein
LITSAIRFGEFCYLKAFLDAQTSLMFLAKK